MSRDTSSSEFYVSLSPSQHDFVAERVREGGYASASDYVRELILRDERAQEVLERKLLEALETPSLPLTEEVWAQLRQNVLERSKRRDAS